MGSGNGATRALALGDARQPHFARWIAALQRAGVEVRALSYEAPLAPLPCPVEALPARGPRFLRHRAALPVALERAGGEGIDLVTALFVPDYGLLGADLVQALARSGRATPQLWVAPLGSDLLRNAGRTPFHAARARQVLRRADLVLVDAAVLERAAVARGADPARIRRVDWRPDLALFAFRAEPPEGRAQILSTRQHAAVYDVETLLRAALQLFRRRSDFELVIAGDGPRRARLMRMARPMGERVRFVGRLGAPELARQLQSATLYVSASRNDSTSVSLLEAMACGTFPVVSAIPGNQEWVVEGSSGLIFPPGNAGILAHKLVRALDDSMLRERAAFLNRRRIEGMKGFEESVGELVKGI